MKLLSFFANLANTGCRRNVGVATACAIAVATALGVACQGTQSAPRNPAAPAPAQMDPASSLERSGSVAPMPSGSAVEEALVAQATEAASQPEPNHSQAGPEAPAVQGQPQPSPPNAPPPALPVPDPAAAPLLPDPAVAALSDALQQAMLQSQANDASGAPLEPVQIDLSNINIDLSAIQQMMSQMNQMAVPQGTPGSSPSPTNSPR